MGSSAEPSGSECNLPRRRTLAHLPSLAQISIENPIHPVERIFFRPRKLNHMNTELDLAQGVIDLVDHAGDGIDAVQRTTQMQLPLARDGDPHSVHRLRRLACLGNHGGFGGRVLRWLTTCSGHLEHALLSHWSSYTFPQKGLDPKQGL